MFPLFQHLRMFFFQGNLGFWWFPFFFCPWGVLYTIVFYRWRSRSWTRLFVTLWVMLDLFVSLFLWVYIPVVSCCSPSPCVRYLVSVISFVPRSRGAFGKLLVLLGVLSLWLSSPYDLYSLGLRPGVWFSHILAYSWSGGFLIYWSQWILRSFPGDGRRS